MTRSWASSPATRKVMLANRGRDTKPELLVRHLAHSRGLRYLVDKSPVPGVRARADMVFRGARIAVFIDGCFWHGCPVHYTVSRSNPDYWSAKLLSNRERDARTTLALAGAGWRVLRFWEHEDPNDVVYEIERAVRRRDV